LGGEVAPVELDRDLTVLRSRETTRLCHVEEQGGRLRQRVRLFEQLGGLLVVSLRVARLALGVESARFCAGIAFGTRGAGGQ
jgi:hypothetical protein